MNEDDGFCDIDVDRAGFWYLLYLSAVLCAADWGDSVCDSTGNERLGVDYWVIHLLAISELRETAVRVKEWWIDIIDGMQGWSLISMNG